VPEDEVTLMKEQVPKRMAGVAMLDVPLLAEVGVGNNWEEAH
ncbi:MAG: polymerase, partial [Pseudomonadota bacterium]